jgi:hypothetical protein
MVRLSFLGPALLCVVLVQPVTSPAADVYKWVDKDGNVHFGDKPGAGAERVTVKAPPPALDAEAAARAAKRERMLDVYQEEREERRELAAKEKADREERKRKCAEAREKQVKYDTAGYIYRRDAAGNRQILSDEEHASVRRQVADLVKTWCK